MHGQSRVLSLVSFGSLFLTVGGLVLACAATTSTGVIEQEAGTDPGDSGTKDAAKDATKEDAKKPPVDPPKTDAECASKGTQQTCYTCCAGYHPAGYQTFQNALQACACGGGGPCVTECASTGCKTPPGIPDATCQTCLQGAIGGQCLSPLTAACQPDADCVAAYMCFSQCPAS